MASQIEPPMKKPKLDEYVAYLITEAIDKCIEMINNSEKNLKAVLSDDIEQPVQLIKVYLGHIKSVQEISHVIKVLNDKIPLKNLSHLKRVRRQDVILCPVSFLHDMSSIQEYVEHHIAELKDVFEYFKEAEVPLLAPRVTKQYNEARKIWSCNFHPNMYLEKLISDNFFNSFELKIHRHYMTIVFEIVRHYAIQNKIQFSADDMFQNINATIVVDPNLDSIVAIAFDNRQEHPIQHSAMLAIDNVAKTQNGGAWNCNYDKESLPGIDKEVMQYIKEKFQSLKYGAKKFKGKNDMSVKENEKEGPYLCTGYYVYMLKEPCLMCSMALVHARAKRVFFCLDNHECGGLSSKTKLQTVSSLNHHFEVFTGFITSIN